MKAKGDGVTSVTGVNSPRGGEDRSDLPVLRTEDLDLPSLVGDCSPEPAEVTRPGWSTFASQHDIRDLAAAKGEVWLCPITKDVPVTIGRGENTGHTVTYHNVVRRWIKLGDWNGTAHTFTLPVRDIGAGDIDTVAVVVQSGTKEAPGAMLGANVAALH